MGVKTSRRVFLGATVPAALAGSRVLAWFKNGDRYLAETRFLGRRRGLARR